jgi:23S rRNA (cytosine1962-C5)-methyltransferase
MYPKVHLHAERAKNIIHGHPWVFSKAIERLEELSPGEICEVFTGQSFLGIGYYNPRTDIAIRLLSRRRERIDSAFFRRRFSQLKAQKERWVQETDAYRLVNGEGDGLPGLVVDRYAQVMVVQFHTLGMARLAVNIVEALQAVMEPRCIYRKESTHSCRIEGMDPLPGAVLSGSLPEQLIICEGRYRFLVDVQKGQKTGFFLDQRENRRSIAPYVQDRRVLNCFCYTGGFSVYAASHADTVTSLDISAAAVDLAKQNFHLNDLHADRHEFVVGDVFDYLKNIPSDRFDTIILDPPSFARRRGQLQQATRAYIAINTQAAKALPRDGILISSSCTTHIDEPDFLRILYQSAVNAGCHLKVLHSAKQPFDHAIDLHFPEGRYLKFVVMLKI